MKWDATSLYPFYHFHPLNKDLDISWVIAAETSPLHIAGSYNQTSGICSLEFTVLVAAVVRGMLKTWITLRDIFCVLLNLACILLNLINISNVQRLLLPLNFHTEHSYFLFSSPIMAVFMANFVPLPYLFGECHDMYIQLGRVYLRDV